MLNIKIIHLIFWKDAEHIHLVAYFKYLEHLKRLLSRFPWLKQPFDLFIFNLTFCNCFCNYLVFTLYNGNILHLNLFWCDILKCFEKQNKYDITGGIYSF